MAPQHGSKAKFTWNSIDLTSYLTGDLSAADESDTVDVTAYGAPAEVHVTSPIQKGQDMVIEGNWDATIHAQLSGARGVDANALLSPIGTTTGLPKWTQMMTGVKYEFDASVTGAEKFKLTLRTNGLGAWGTY